MTDEELIERLLNLADRIEALSGEDFITLDLLADNFEHQLAQAVEDAPERSRDG